MQNLLFVLFLDPAKVSHLSITPSEQSDTHGNAVSVNQGTKLRVLCKWDRGQPTSPRPSQVKLVASKDVMFDEMLTREGELRASFRADCDDTGDIACLVPGSSGNKTVKLSVKCKYTL